MSVLTFVQLEFPWKLGPADGRYLIRTEPSADPETIVAFDAAEREARRGWIQWWQSPGPKTMVRLSRVTVIDARPLDEAAAREWLAGADGDHAVATLRGAFACLNRVLSAYRAAAASPAVVDVFPEQAVRMLAGYGSPDAVSNGQSKATVTFPRADEVEGLLPAPETEIDGLDAPTRFARLLSGSDYPLMCEELLLRARGDLDNGREAAATLMAHLALESMASELSDDPDVSADDLAQAEHWREQFEGAAEGALEADVPVRAVADLGRALDDLEAILRNRLVSRAG